MIDTATACDRVSALIDKARRAGADAADAITIGEASSGVSVRLGALEDVHSSEGAEIGLRVFRGRRSASVASSDPSDAALDQLVERAMAMAAEAPEDEYAGLAPSDMLARGPLADLDLDDAGEIDPQALRARAEEAEDAARAVSGITNSNGGSSSASRSVVALATSDGFANAYRASGHSCSASVVAGEGSAMQRDYAWHSARHLKDLEAPDVIGRRAGERTVKKLGPVSFTGGTMAVLFEPRVATSLLGHFAGAINGASIARQASFLLGKLGEKVFADGITLVDDPTRKGALRSRLFDGEGLPVKRMELVSDGVLNGWLAASAAARQLGIAPTGHAVRGISGPPGAGPSNLYIEAGARSREEMFAAEERAIFVTELIGQGVNGITGDYSRGASGFLIEKGEIVGPVSGITIASNLIDMLRTLEPASDLQFRRGIDSPTLRVPAMTVAAG